MTESQAFQAAPYRYAIKYYVVDDFGDLIWGGRCTIRQDRPMPSDEVALAVLGVQTAKTIRDSAPPEMPDGRILIAAVTELS